MGGCDGPVAFPMSEVMRRYRQRRRRPIRSPADGRHILSDDDPLFDEREIEIVAGVDEKSPATNSPVV
jgi:hypothetical protein